MHHSKTELKLLYLPTQGWAKEKKETTKQTTAVTTAQMMTINMSYDRKKKKYLDGIR